MRWIVRIREPSAHVQILEKLYQCRLRLPAQPVNATQVLNLSAGVSNPKVFRRRSFS